MEREAGLASIAGGCVYGSLTEVPGSENPWSSSIVIGSSTDLSNSHGNRKLFADWATYLESRTSRDNPSKHVLQSVTSFPLFETVSRGSEPVSSDVYWIFSSWLQSCATLELRHPFKPRKSHRLTPASWLSSFLVKNRNSTWGCFSDRRRPFWGISYLGVKKYGTRIWLI